MTEAGSSCVDRMAILYRCDMFRLDTILERWKKSGLIIKINILPALRWAKRKLKERKYK